MMLVSGNSNVAPVPRGVWGILQSIRRLFRRDDNEIPERGIHVPYVPWYGAELPWETEFSRKRQFEDIEAMDRDDGIISRCLDLIAERATVGEGDRFAYWFKTRDTVFDKDSVERSDNVKLVEEAVRILNNMLLRTGINTSARAWDDIRAIVKFGNWFWEITFGIPGRTDNIRLFQRRSVNDTPYISRVKPFPYPYQIVCNVDIIAEKKSGKPGFCGPGEAAWEQYSETGDLIAQWDAYEIVHATFGSRQGGVYATPILEPLRRHWRRLRAKEDSMAVARITRAYPRLKHKILVPASASPNEVQQAFNLYRENVEVQKSMSVNESTGSIITSARHTPIDVETDFYLASYYTDDGRVVSGDVEEVGGSAPHLADLTDIYWDVARILARIGVPMKYLNIYIESARPFIEQDQETVDEAFARFILRLQAAYREAIWHVAMLELLLNGINPMEVADSIEITLPAVSLMGSHIQSRILNLRAQTALIWQKLGIPEGIIGDKVLEMTNNEVVEWMENQQSGGSSTNEDDVEEIIKNNIQSTKYEQQ